jgi:hypothetical protein
MPRVDLIVGLTAATLLEPVIPNTTNTTAASVGLSFHDGLTWVVHAQNRCQAPWFVPASLHSWRDIVDGATFGRGAMRGATLIANRGAAQRRSPRSILDPTGEQPRGVVAPLLQSIVSCILFRD